MDTFGDIIRKLRKDYKLPLREVAEVLEIDQAILSKVERGQRRLTRDQVTRLADYFQVSKEDLIVAWLSDKIIYTLADEGSALKAIQLAEKQVEYRSLQNMDRKKILNQLRLIIKRFPAVTKMWVYGSFAREDDKPGSDIDLAIQANEHFSYFDLAEIQHDLENAIHRKVDIGFMDSFKPHIRKNIEPDLKLVYEKSTA